MSEKTINIKHAVFSKLSILLLLSTVFLNGSTDACNAIATVVGAGAMQQKHAVRLSACFNTVGVLSGAFYNNRVQKTLNTLLDLQEEEHSGIIVFSILFSVVVWTACAWYLAVPRSDSHSLTAAIAGVNLLVRTKAHSVIASWITVLGGLFLSVLIGFLSAFYLQHKLNKSKLTDLVSQRNDIVKKLQILFAALMSYLHGLQDGQKFIGLAFCYMNPEPNATGGAAFHFGIRFLIAFIMGMGTLFGGGKIVTKIAFELTQLNPVSGFSADFVSSLIIMLSSVIGLPVSTTQVKTAAVSGVGWANDGRIDRKCVRDVILLWVLTFPVCTLLSSLMLRILLLH